MTSGCTPRGTMPAFVQSEPAMPEEPADFLSIPAEAAESFSIAGADGVVLRGYRLHGPETGPALLVGHATGLAAGSYLPWLDMLGVRARVFAYDARGHGGSALPDGAQATPDRTFTLERFARDLASVAAAVRDRIGAVPLHFAGHSVASAAALALGAEGGEAPFAGLVLFEPPVVPGVSHPLHATAHANVLARAAGTEKRRRAFPSPEAFAARLGERGVFALFRRDMLAAHCRATLRPDGADGYVLACDPRTEAAFYRAVAASDLWRHLPRFPQPARFVGGDPEISDPGSDRARWITTVAREIAGRVPAGAFDFVPGAGHMMIFEQPERCRDLVFRMLDGG